MSIPWTCPECGTEYEFRPKWCPCTPYPLEHSSSTYALAGPRSADQQRNVIELSPTEFEALLAGLSRAAGFGQLVNFGEATPEGDYHIWEMNVEPHVETLDSYLFRYIHLEKDEYDRLLAMLTKIRESQ